MMALKICLRVKGSAPLRTLVKHFKTFSDLSAFSDIWFICGRQEKRWQGSKERRDLEERIGRRLHF